jgi:hypothetical protein
VKGFRLPLVAKLILLAVVLLLATVSGWEWWRDRRESSRRGVVALPSIGAELLFMDGNGIARRGPGVVVVVRFGGGVEFQPYHYRADGYPETMTVESWASKLGAAVVFNAGQFDESLDHLGWLKRDGRWLAPRKKSTYKALLVSGPLGGSYWARVVDLDHTEPDIADQYSHVVQSMMLVDSGRNLRVRDTDLAASRTVVAEDTRGRILLVLTEGAVTLGDLARWLSGSRLDIVRAMNLDGGVESQLAVDTPELKLVLYGQYGTGSAFKSGGGQVRYPLPAVVAVRPRPESGPSSE